MIDFIYYKLMGFSIKNSWRYSPTIFLKSYYTKTYLKNHINIINNY